MKNLDRTRLQAALIEATIQSAEEKIAQSPMPAETADEEKVRAILEDVREKEKRKRAKHFKRAWVIVAVALLAVLSGCAVMYKTGLVQFVVTRFEKHDKVTQASEYTDYPQAIEEVKIPKVMPEGYEELEKQQISFLVRVKWINENNDYIVFTQTILKNAYHAIDNENGEYSQMKLGEHTIFTYHSVGENPVYIWKDDYEFKIESSKELSESELLQIIDSVQ